MPNQNDVWSDTATLNQWAANVNQNVNIAGAGAGNNNGSGWQAAGNLLGGIFSGIASSSNQMYNPYGNTGYVNTSSQFSTNMGGGSMLIVGIVLLLLFVRK